MLKKFTVLFILLFLPIVCLAAEDSAQEEKKEQPKVVFDTTAGEITIELFADAAPISVKNFIDYVEAGFYDGLIFHRVIPGFVIQGGGFEPGMKKRPTKEPIKNEAKNGKANRRGTLSMARTNVVDSATSQFFINLKDNFMLDHRGDNNYGYAVFGRVVDGMEVVDKIAAMPTGMKGMHRDVPKEDVIIKSAKVEE